MQQVLTNTAVKPNLSFFAKIQKHSTTLFEVCLTMPDAQHASKSINATIKIFMGTMTDQADLFFQLKQANSASGAKEIAP